MKRLAFILVLLAAAVAGLCAQQAPHAAANAAFDSYVAVVEAGLQQQHSTAAGWTHLSAQQLEELHGGQALLEAESAGRRVAGGMIHHWRGTILVPGATAEDFLRQQQQLDRFSSDYAPQVVRASIAARQGSSLAVIMRMRYRKVITVTLDGDYAVQYGALDATHGYSLSRSTKIAEIESPETSHEHALSPDEDHGFLWRINTYWSYEQRPDGLLLQCEAVSLTRDIPAGLDWLVRPFLNSIPRESLQFTLVATRKALLARRKP